MQQQSPPVILEFPTLIEVKCLRIQRPKQNYQTLPLSGIYNDISSVEDTAYPLENKFKNFDICEKECIGIENMFGIYPKFGKVLFMEHLEAILIFINKSDKELRLKDLKIGFTNQSQNQKDVLSKVVNLSIFDAKNIISIPGNQYFSIKFKVLIDTVAKYSIDIGMNVLSQLYNEKYERESRTKNICNSTGNYKIENGVVQKEFVKHLTFETVVPFKVQDKFNNLQMKKCQIEVNVTNLASMPLMIYDISLYPEKNQNMELKSLGYEKNKNFIMENTEEKNLIFQIEDSEIFTKNDNYYLLISWANMYDTTPKFFKSIISNKLNIVNPFFTLNILEQPSETIIQNQSFKVLFQVVNKTKKTIKVNINALKYDTDRPGDREFDVIDIVDNTIELREKANFCLICKCDILGTVCLPKLLLTVEDTKFNFDKLLYFNCVPELKFI